MKRSSLAALVLGAMVLGCPHAREAPCGGVHSSDPIPHTVVRSRPAAREARIHLLKAGEELGGPNATGKPGDWVLENDHVVFVVDALGGGAGFAESGGNLVDAADAHTRKDELGQLFTYFGKFPRQAVYTKLEATSESLKAWGRELYDPSIEVETEYVLGPTERALLIRTTLTNRGSQKVTGLGLGDAIQWGGTEKLAPGKPSGFKGKSTGPFIGAVGRLASYAIIATDGDISALSGSTWTDTEQQQDVAIEPGKSVSYARAFIVGGRPDIASIVSELPRVSGASLGRLAIKLVTAKGEAVRALPGSKVSIGTPGLPITLVAIHEELALHDPNAATFVGEVPVGTWEVGYVPSNGRRADGANVTATVKAGEPTTVTLTVTDAGSATIDSCKEEPSGIPLPCKFTIEGLDGTATPDFGPPHLASAAKNVITLGPSHQANVPLPHGRYRVTASRGPEYDLAPIEITVPGAAPMAFALHRVVETKGYVSADFHQHSILSADAPVATRDRVLANAAEGVEVAVATEHNAIADLAQTVADMKLGDFLVQIAGDELTSDASKKPFGHANVYPVAAQPDRPRNGAPQVRDRLAADVFADARALPGGPHVLQVNHPRSGMNGYFDQLGFDPRTGIGTGPGYDASFDAIEVWNGRVVAHRSRVLEDYFALLRTSHPATPIADTDTHGIVGEEPGYPRTFVRLPGEDASPVRWDAARSQDLVTSIRETRDVVLSNGPFMAVSANGVGIGGVATPRSGRVDVRVTVTTAPWVVVEKAELRLAKEGTLQTAPLEPKRNAAGALVAEASFSVPVKADDAFVVMVSGTKAMRPVLSTAGQENEIAPWAMSGPIWIDADADGRSLGRERR